MIHIAHRATRNQENSLAAFAAKKPEFDALLAELSQASDDHFGADPATVLWGVRPPPRSDAGFGAGRPKARSASGASRIQQNRPRTPYGET
jgi:hypothetical protein